MLSKVQFENGAWKTWRNSPGDRLLTLSLAFQDGAPPELAALPWEFLFQPDDKIFLSTDPTIAFSYRRAEWSPGSGWGFNEPPRVMLVRMQPEELDLVAMRQVENFLKEQVRQGKNRLDPVTLENPTPEVLEQSLRACRPHILHFFGHGQFSEDGSRFALVDGDGNSLRWMGDKSLAEIIGAYPPRLVVLQACEGGRLSDARTFAHGGAWLVRRGVAAVAAMRYPITNLSGAQFSESMYKALLEGQPVDQAVQLGRRRLAFARASAPNSHANRTFAAPMVWLNPAPSSWTEGTKMHTTIYITAPDQSRYEADVPLDLPVGALLQDFVTNWEPVSHGPARRFGLRRRQIDGEALAPVASLREAGIADRETLYLVAEPLQPNATVGLTITDQAGQDYTTAVLLNTPLRKLAEAFLAGLPGKGEIAVELIEARPRRLALAQTLYEAGINDNSTLHIYRQPSKEGLQ